MLQSERIEKLRSNHTTVNKTYPPHIECKNIIVDYKAINPIDFNDIKNDIIRMEITDNTKSPPTIYKNEKTNQYYIQYNYSGPKFSKYLFEITDNYNWNKVLQEKVIKEEFITKKVTHIMPILENKVYFPGTTQYDSIYPPVK